MPAPVRQVQLMITERCNLRCVHCAVPAEDSPAEYELAPDVWRHFVSVLARDEVKSLILSGGEVFLRKDTVDLAVHAHECGIPQTVIVTNMSRMDAALAAALAAAQRRFRDFQILVSIDGATEATHGWMRRRGSLAELLENADTLRGAGGSITGVNSVIHRGNVHELDALQDLVRGLGARHWRWFPIAEIGRGIAVQDHRLPGREWEALLAGIPSRAVASGLDIVAMGPILGGDTEYPEGRGPNPNAEATQRTCVGPDGQVFLCPPLRAQGVASVPDLLDVVSWRAAAERVGGLIERNCAQCKFLLLCVGANPREPLRALGGRTFHAPR